MGSYTWYCTNTNDGYTEGIDTVWATARADAWGDYDITAALIIATYCGASLHYCSQGHVDFQTGDGNIPAGATITSVVLSLWCTTNDAPGTGFILEAFQNDWGGTVSNGVHRNDAALQALYDGNKLCATIDAYGKATGQYHDFTSTANFAGLINRTASGYTRLTIATENHRDGLYGDPPLSTYWRTYWGSANQAGQQPKLTVNWSSGPDAPVLTAVQHLTHIDVGWS